MIDRPALIAWRSKAPWPDRVQVAQDLLLSRLMIEIARDEVLGGELAMRGGTCMHKLHLPAALRYSEDLDYVRLTHSGIKPYTQALARIAADTGLTVSSRQRSGQMVHVYLDGQPTEGIGRIRVKIEMNIIVIPATSIARRAVRDQALRRRRSGPAAQPRQTPLALRRGKQPETDPYRRRMSRQAARERFAKKIRA